MVGLDRTDIQKCLATEEVSENKIDLVVSFHVTSLRHSIRLGLIRFFYS